MNKNCLCRKQLAPLVENMAEFNYTAVYPYLQPPVMTGRFFAISAFHCLAFVTLLSCVCCSPSSALFPFCLRLF